MNLPPNTEGTMNTENSTGLSGLRVTRIINTARVMLDYEARTIIVRALRRYYSDVEDTRPQYADDLWLLANIIRHADDAALDMPTWDDENGTPDARTMALLDDLRERGAVTA